MPRRFGQNAMVQRIRRNNERVVRRQRHGFVPDDERRTAVEQNINFGFIVQMRQKYLFILQSIVVCNVKFHGYAFRCVKRDLIHTQNIIPKPFEIVNTKKIMNGSKIKNDNDVWYFLLASRVCKKRSDGIAIVRTFQPPPPR